MAMNLLNPIQLLRGTSAAIAAAQGKEGTLYYDMQRGNLVAKGVSIFNEFPRVVYDANSEPIIYVDAVNGDDNNSGFTVEQPVKTLDKAFYLYSIRISIRIPIIQLASGTYTTSICNIPKCRIIGAGKDTTFINIPYISMVNVYLFIEGVSIKCTKSIDYNYNIVSYNSSLYINNSYIQISGDCDTALYICDTSYMYLSSTEIHSVDVNCKCFLFSNFTSSVQVQDLHISGNITCTRTFTASSNSAIYIPAAHPIVSTGTVIGSRYLATNGSVIVTDGQGSAAIPGTTDGETNTGGTYY